MKRFVVYFSDSSTARVKADRVKDYTNSIKFLRVIKRNGNERVEVVAWFRPTHVAGWKLER